ncbi:hypothetical protein AYI69_g4296 [Smittium culicis]|uniref:Uncharacterized protein n=1 Tax=Smittium culicis TaxID=133412 RepID=A0A1R1YF66_9FUNG|nr:hypothetical protein AYI69_g4296 [Smittium culicis]
MQAPKYAEIAKSSLQADIEPNMGKLMRKIYTQEHILVIEFSTAIPKLLRTDVLVLITNKVELIRYHLDSAVQVHEFQLFSRRTRGKRRVNTIVDPKPRQFGVVADYPALNIAARFYKFLRVLLKKPCRLVAFFLV